MDKFGKRLASIITQKLGVEVTFSHWIKKATGDVPVFHIPASHEQTARLLALVSTQD
jgi:monoamine oxidase